MGNKSKSKHRPGPSVVDLVELVRGHLRRGQGEEALENLRAAEAKLRQATQAPGQSPGKKISIPPHLVAAQNALPDLFARARLILARQEAEPRRKVEHLREAAARVPRDGRIALALVAARMMAGEKDAAAADFRRAAELLPSGGGLAARTLAMAALASGRPIEAKEALERVSPEERDAGWQRLATIVGLLGGLDARIEGVRESFPLLTGVEHLARGDRDAALRQFASSLAQDRQPTEAEAALLTTELFYAGAIRFEAGEDEAALSSLSEVLWIASSYRWRLPWMSRLTALGHTAANRLAPTNPSLSLKWWEAVARHFPDDPVARTNQALGLRARAIKAGIDGDFETCAKSWDEILLANPQNEEALKNLALAREKCGRPAEAIDAWRRLDRLWQQQFKQRAVESGFKERWLTLGHHIVKLLLDTGQPVSEVVDQLEAMLRHDPENLDLRRQAFDRLIEIELPERALKHLDKIEQQDGRNANTVVRRAVALADADRWKEAMSHFEEAIALDPGNQSFRRAFLLFLDREVSASLDRRNIQRAIDLLNRQLALDGAYFPAYGQLAGIKLSAGEYGEGKKLLEKIAEVVPDKWEIRIGIAKVYLQFDFAKDAARHFEFAVSLSDSFSCLEAIGKTYLEFDLPGKAVKYFDRAAEKADVEQLVELSNLMVDEGRRKDANRYLAMAKKADPLHPLPWLSDTLFLLEKRGAFLPGSAAYRKAQAALETAAKLTDANPAYQKYLEPIQAIRDEMKKSPVDRMIELLDRMEVGDDWEQDDDDFPNEFDSEPPFIPPPTRGKQRRR